MRTLKHIINWVVWTAVLLYAVLLGTIRTPWAQRQLGSYVSEAVGRALGTTVQVGRIDLGFLNRLILDDVIVYDQQHQQMLRAARLTAKVDVTQLTQGRIVVSSAQVFGAHLQLYQQDGRTPANFQFVLDSLASADTTAHTPMDLRVNSFIMRHSSVSYDRWDVAPANRRLDPQHLNVSDISAHVILKQLTDDSLSVNVKRLAFNEQSGMAVQKLAFALNVGNREASLRNLDLLLPASRLHIDSVTATYDRQRLKETLNYAGSMSATQLSSADLACLHPTLMDLHQTVAASAHFQGTANSLDLPLLKIATEDNSATLVASGGISRHHARTAWNVQVSTLHLTANAIRQVSDRFTRLPDMAMRTGGLQLSGNCDMSPEGNLTAQIVAQTEAGTVTADGHITTDNTFTARLSTEDANLRQLLDDEHWGHLATDMELSGCFQEGMWSLLAQGTVAAIDYDGHEYNNIEVNGGYGNHNVKGRLSIDDDRIKAELETDVTATGVNDAVGTVTLRNLLLPESGYAMNLLQLTSGFTDSHHYVTLHSDFAEAQLTGQFDYTTLAQSITNFVGSKLPTLPGLPPISAVANNNFALQLTMTSADWMRKLWDVDIELHRPLQLTATVSDGLRQISLNGDLPQFSYDGSHYAAGHVSISSPRDTAFISATIDKLTDSGQPLTLSLQGNAANNNLTTSLAWDNHDSTLPMSGRLNVIGHLYRNLDSQPEAHINVLPSDIMVNGVRWQVEPSDILYSTNHLLVDHFAIHNGDQYIKADGTASKSTGDSLHIDLKDIEVAYILNLVDFDAVEFSGEATGRATVVAAFADPSAFADLTVNHFRFEKGRMGVLTARVGWNKQLEQIDIDATANDGPDAMTFIRGFVAPAASTHHPEASIDLSILGRGTHIDFMQSFTESFLSDISGHAYGDLRLHGPLSTIQLTGQLVVDGQATVTTLGTTYSLRRDTVVLVPDDILLRRIPIHDRYDNTAYLSGGIHHKHLTSLTFDLNVETERLLGYDFSTFGDNSFHGTVFAAGSVSIEGRPGRVTIDCNVTPLSNTVFTYNVAQADAITSQEFITWASPDAHQPTPTTNGTSTITQPPTTTDIYLNFLINTTPEATMRLLMDPKTDDYITLNGNGVLRATYYNKGTFQMFGTYTTTGGTYDVTIQNIIKKNFTFQPGGTVVFGGDPYDAALALQAVYTVSGVSLSDLQLGNSFSSNTIRVNCLMNIGGQPNAPVVDFDLEMPNVNADEQQMVRSVINGQQEMNQQVLYLLAIGRFYTQGQNNASNTQTDQTSLAMQSLLSGTLSTQINTVLGNVIKNDSWNFGANIATGTEGWNNAEYEGIVAGRMLNNRLLINGQFGYRDGAASAGIRGGNAQANPSFIGDFDIRYLLYPNGNLALKVYNQTNDRYFTRSSLNTQGIGVIMKKDFNTLSELLGRKRKKESPRNLQIQREPE